MSDSLPALPVRNSDFGQFSFESDLLTDPELSSCTCTFPSVTTFTQNTQSMAIIVLYFTSHNFTYFIFHSCLLSVGRLEKAAKAAKAAKKGTSRGVEVYCLASHYLS